MRVAIEVTRVYKEHLPALRLIGRRYTDADRGADGFGRQWDAWWAGDGFAALERAAGAPLCRDTLGLMTMRGDGTGFAYWIGLFFPAGTPAPRGCDYLDLPESDIGVGWVRGEEKSGELFGGPPHEAVCAALAAAGLAGFRDDIAGPGSGVYCFFERYNCPRFTVQDEEGKVTLDYGNYIW